MNTTESLSGASYVGALIALLVLTATSYFMSRLDLGEASTVLALGIAAVKAVIVACIFMHLVRASFTIRFILVVTALFIALLSLGIVSDVAMR